MAARQVAANQQKGQAPPVSARKENERYSPMRVFRKLAEREGFEPSVQVLARTTV